LNYARDLLVKFEKIGR